MTYVLVNGKPFEWTQVSINAAVMAGVKVEVIGERVAAYHPKHHQTCFCAVCRGGDGHIDDKCECGKCQ